MFFIAFMPSQTRDLIHERHYATPEEARRSILDYIELYYNAERIRSAIGYQTPWEWEQRREHTNPNRGR